MNLVSSNRGENTLDKRSRKNVEEKVMELGML